MTVKKQDSPLSLLFRDNTIAKDLINHVLAFPEEIHAEDLPEGDTRETGKYETGLKSFFRTRYRDVKADSDCWHGKPAAPESDNDTAGAGRRSAGLPAAVF